MKEELRHTENEQKEKMEMDGGRYSKENRRVKKKGDHTKERKIKDRIRKRMIGRNKTEIDVNKLFL